MAFLGIIAVAQDTLFFKDGSLLPVRLVDVGSENVSFHKWSNLNGPIWNKPLSSISEIRYEKVRNDGNASTNGPSLLIFTDGSSMEVSLVEVNDDVVRYKNWSYLNGPTWIKPRSYVADIKQDNITLDFSDDKSTGYNKIISGNEIVRHIDSLYYNNYSTGNVIIASRDIPIYIKSLPNNINLKKIHGYYFEKLEQAQKTANDDEIIRYGEIYMYVGGEKNIEGVIRQVAVIYASRGNEDMVNNMIEKLRILSFENDNVYDAYVKKLEIETYKLLHPISPEDEYIGTWIEVAEKYHGINPLILKINDTKDPYNGVNMLENDAILTLKKHDSKKYIVYPNMINVSQVSSYRGDLRRYQMQFSSDSVSDFSWMLDYQTKLLEYNSKKTATDLANAKLKNKSQKEIFTETYANVLSSQLLQVSIQNLSYTYANAKHYLFSLSEPISTNFIIAQEEHSKIQSSATRYGSDIYGFDDHKSVIFVRWEEKDSLVFVSQNYEPITLTPFKKNDPLLRDYYKIKKSTSFAHPKYFLPFLAGCALSGYFMYLGVINDKGSAFVTGIVGGAVATLSASIAIPILLSEKHRKKKFAELNSLNYEKVKQKLPNELPLEYIR